MIKKIKNIINEFPYGLGGLIIILIIIGVFIAWMVAPTSNRSVDFPCEPDYIGSCN